MPKMVPSRNAIKYIFKELNRNDAMSSILEDWLSFIKVLKVRLSKESHVGLVKLQAHIDWLIDWLIGTDYFIMTPLFLVCIQRTMQKKKIPYIILIFKFFFTIIHKCGKLKQFTWNVTLT